MNFKKHIKSLQDRFAKFLAQQEFAEQKKVCANCHYFQRMSNSLGYCKFNPPYTRIEKRYKYYSSTGQTDKNLTEDICHKEYQHVNDYDFCGQHLDNKKK